MEIQLTYCELRKKDVINLVDGRKLGRLIDVVFNIKGHIEGFVVPGIKKWSFFKATDDIFIKWCDIKKIGEDVILVELRPHSSVHHPKGCEKDKDRDRDRCGCFDEDICIDFMPNNDDNDWSDNFSNGGNNGGYYMDAQRPMHQKGAYYKTSKDQNINYFMKYYDHKG
ncbi:MAG TPA: YlmC/YmxH family sporulation protein [Clostridia bacterium]